MSHNQRLGYQRLAEVLVERGLVEPQAVQDALTMGAHGGLPFPEALVTANLVADWELSRVVCELYGLPFLTVDMVEPDPDAKRGLDLDFLRQNGLVPLSRHGRLLTICMPSVVPAEVLGLLASESQCQVMPVVGTVQTNRRWLSNHMEPAAALPQDAGDLAADNGSWSNLFDEADAAVLSALDLGEVDLDGEDEAEGLELAEPAQLVDPAEPDEAA